MDPRANPLSVARSLLAPAPGPGGAWGAVQAVGQMMLLPWNVLAILAAGVARLVDAAQPAAGMARPVDAAQPAAASGVGMLPPPPAIENNDRTTSGAANAGAGTTIHKETKMSYEDPCGDVDDCQIRLYSYTIVTIKRGFERILYRGAKLVTDPMDQCEFDAWVIAEYLQSADHHKAQEDDDPDCRPIAEERDKRWLRVSSEIQHTWGKQPLHYQEKQLRLLEKIADRMPARN